MCSNITKANLADILERAKDFAIKAHESINQRRKYTDEPYYVHCGRVVKILSEVTIDQEILAAAWMHDILEDVAPHNPDYSENKIRQLLVIEFAAWLLSSRIVNLSMAIELHVKPMIEKDWSQLQ